ncbi:MAG: response regulator transcription factor [Patescibacteria group bacterium]|nr:response regulator transcription factor [Patescibacteria group bacterium]
MGLSDRAPKEATIRFSPRKVQILRLVAFTHSDKEIASQLGISIYTVRAYVRNMCDALGLSTRRELARWGMQHPEALRGEPAARRTHEPDPDCLCPFCVAFS